MSHSITQTQLQELHARCRSGIERLFFSMEAQKDARRLDAAALLDNLTWKVLTPILVAVTSGLVGETLKKLLASNKAEGDPKTEAQSVVGKQVVQMNTENYAVCLEMVEDAIKSLGGTREHAGVILTAILKQMDCEVPKKADNNVLDLPAQQGADRAKVNPRPWDSR